MISKRWQVLRRRGLTMSDLFEPQPLAPTFFITGVDIEIDQNQSPYSVAGGKWGTLHIMTRWFEYTGYVYEIDHPHNKGKWIRRWNISKQEWEKVGYELFLPKIPYTNDPVGYFSRIRTPIFAANIDAIRTYNYDIRLAIVDYATVPAEMLT